MQDAQITFVSPKGYGMAKLSSYCQPLVFIPRNVMQRGLKSQEIVRVELEKGEMGLRATALESQISAKRNDFPGS